METTVLNVGTVSLASLFYFCVKSFEFSNHIQSFCDDDELLLIKLDYQKERLLTWGELVDVSKESRGDCGHNNLDEKASEVEKYLNAITKLCNDTTTRGTEYGLEECQQPTRAKSESLTETRTRFYKLSYATSKLPHTISKQNNSVLETRGQTPDENKYEELIRDIDTTSALEMRWKIADRNKFKELTNQFTEILDEMHSLIPVPPYAQNKLIFEDAARLTSSKLKMVELASIEDNQGLNKMVSSIIAVLEICDLGLPRTGASVQHSLASSEPDDAEPAGNISTTVDRSFYDSVYLPVDNISSAYLYFVFASPCPLLRTNYKCDDFDFGKSLCDPDTFTFLPKPASRDSPWSLGKRIISTMFIPDDVDMVQTANFELGDVPRSWEPKKLPVATVYVICAPCIDVISIALELCRQETSSVITLRVRVDDRINAHCCSHQTQLARLKSLIHTMKVNESSPEGSWGPFAWDVYVDRLWIEQRIFTLEEKGPGDETLDGSSAACTTELFSELRVSTSDKTGFVILGEPQKCQWIMQANPFPWKSRLPKETEIYRLRMQNSKWHRSFLGTFTPWDYYLRDAPTAQGTSTT